MIRWACIFRAAVFSTLCIASATFAEEPKRSARPNTDARVLRADVHDLRVLIATKRSLMASVARLSAHRQLDPTYQKTAQEVAQLEEQLAQRAAELVRQDTDLQQADLRTMLESIISQIAGLSERLSRLEQAQTLATGTLRKVEIDGAQYYIVPVQEMDQQRTPPQRASAQSKVITINESVDE